MKRVFLICISLLMLGTAVAEQSTNDVSTETNNVTSDTIKQIIVKAEKGDAEAECDLGLRYYTGNGIAQDSAKAVKWLRKAAESGLAPAQHDLAFMYGNSFGVERNEAKALEWYRKAAKQGFAGSEFEVGAHYYAGHGVTQDYVEAVKWLKKSALQGYAPAQNNLACCYQNGEGVARNYVESYKWFSLAGAQGIKEAKENLTSLESRMTGEQVAMAQQLAQDFKPRDKSNPQRIIPSQYPVASGTGFFITDDGYLISNNHVVKGATKVRVITRAGTFDAKVIQTDAANDLALLKVEGHFTALPVTPSRKVSLGSTVATVGFPDPGLQGFSPKLAKGEIASLSGAGDDARYFQISVPVQPGNSGGALVDEHGNVVGIVSAKLNAAAALASSGALPENVNYAIKSSYLLSFLESVPGVEARLKPANTKEEKFEDVVKSAQDAAVLVLVY